MATLRQHTLAADHAISQAARARLDAQYDEATAWALEAIAQFLAAIVTRPLPGPRPPSTPGS